MKEKKTQSNRPLKLIFINGGSLEIQEILDRLSEPERRIAVEKIVLLSSGKRVGEIHESEQGPLVIGRLEDIPEEGYDAAILLGPVPDIEWLTGILVRNDIRLLDSAGQLAGKPRIPIFVPDLWDPEQPFPLVAALASPESTVLGIICRTVEKIMDISSMFATILTGASRAGSRRGLDELFDQTRAIMGFGDVPVDELPGQLAFNAFPLSEYEPVNSRVRTELAMILDREIPEFDMTVNWGGFFVGMLGTVWIRTGDPVDISMVTEALESTGFFDFPGKSPGVLDVVGSDRILLAEIRPFASGDKGLTLRFAMDNLRKGLSINLCRILEFLK